MIIRHKDFSALGILIAIKNIYKVKRIKKLWRLSLYLSGMLGRN